MKRTHVLVRLLVLAAMIISFGETVRASTCASMSMPTLADAAADHDAMQDMPAMPADDQQHDGDENTQCPLGAAAVAQGCLTAVSLPASCAAPFAPTDVPAVDMGSVDAAYEYLYPTPPFHPPRA